MSCWYMGIDVAKDSLVTYRVNDGKGQHRTYSNDQEGIDRMLAELGRLQAPVHIVMEATGRLFRQAALALWEAGHRISVVNPALPKAYAKSCGLRNKGDKADARTLALFAKANKPAAWQPPCEHHEQLRELSRHRHQLVDLVQKASGRLRSIGEVEVISDSLRGLIEHMKQEIAHAEQCLEALIEAHEPWKQQVELLDSIKGIGVLTAIVLIAEVGTFEAFDSASALAAFAGVCPSNHRSDGKNTRPPRMSKMGSPHLRRALYMPAITASCHNPPIQAFCDRLAAKGKAEAAIRGAAMHKLIRQCYGVIKNQVPFDPNFGKEAKTA